MLISDMRPIMADDILLVIRALGRVTSAQRRVVLAQWITQAHWADLYRKRLRKPHPLWGNGSLMSRVMMEPLAPHGATIGVDLDAMEQVILTLQLWRKRQTFAAPTACPM